MGWVKIVGGRPVPADKGDPGAFWMSGQNDTDPKPGSQKPGTSDGGGSGGSGGGGYSGGGGSGKTAEQAKAEAVTKDFERQWDALFDGKAPKPPKGLLEAAIKRESVDASWLLKQLHNNHYNVWEDTTQAKKKANEAIEVLDSLFPEDAKIKAAFIKMYLKGNTEMTMDQFFDRKVRNSKVFKDTFPGFEDFYKQYATDAPDKSYRAAAAAYMTKRQSYLSAYQTMFPEAKSVPPAILAKALSMNWDPQVFADWVKKNDPAYLTTPEAAAKGHELDDLWQTMFGASVALPAALKQKWVLTPGDTDADLWSFFNDNVRNSSEFKSLYPDFEDWAMSQAGTPGAAMDVNPLEYFKRKKELEQLYELLAEKPGASNAELIKQAIKSGWSNERFQLEFEKTDPAYKDTEAVKAKAAAETERANDKIESFNLYWKSIMGTDSTPPSDLAYSFGWGTNDDPRSMFEAITQTNAFQSQYGNWSAFAAAQNAAGNSGLIDNPALYKQYKDAFYDEFAKIGIGAPQNMERMFFASGVDPTELSQNLQAYIATNQSYQWQTDTAADVATAAGIGDKVAGGDLKRRMEAALAQHKAYTESKYNTFNVAEKNGSFIRKI